jgi:hypothetical protein
MRSKPIDSGHREDVFISETLSQRHHGPKWSRDPKVARQWHPTAGEICSSGRLSLSSTMDPNRVEVLTVISPMYSRVTRDCVRGPVELSGRGKNS